MRRRNLFTGDKSYSQSPLLGFMETPTEARSTQDRFRFSQQTLKNWSLGLSLLSAWLYFNQEIPTCTLGLLLVSLRLPSFVQGAVLTRLVWTLPNLMFAHVLLQDAPETLSYADGLLTMFSSFVANLCTLRHWTQGIVISSLEAFLISFFESVPIWYLLAPILTFGLLTGVLEKDQRDLWALWDSYKRSEQHYGAVE